MMQGDQYRIPIEFKNTDGSPITQNDIKDIEIFVGVFRKNLSDGDVTFDEAENTFYIYVTQKETFALRGNVKLQARLLFLSGDVVGVNLGRINFDAAISREVLE